MTQGLCSEEEDSYEYPFSDDASEAMPDSEPDNHTQNEAPQCLAVTVKELRAHYKDDVQRITEVLSVEQSTAVAIMRHYEWNVQKVLDRVGGAPEQLQVFGAVIAEDNAAPQDSYDCPVCFMDGPAATFFSAACGHKVCKDCWTKYVNANINDRNQIAELRCPALTAADKPCQYLAVRSLISRIVDPTTLKQLDNHENDLLASGWLVSFSFVRKTRTMYRPVDFWCVCGGTMCFNCRKGAHRPLACEAAQRWEELAERQRGGEGGSSNPQNIDWIMGHTKPCPNCKSAIEKNGGCNHMHCRTCGHHFDWVTNTSSAVQAWHDSLRAERAEAERFMHCYTPWLAHGTSQEMAEEQLEQYRMQWRFELQDRLEIHDAADAEKTLQPLLDAHLCVKRHRQTLRWTYAYAYFAFGPPTPLVPKMTQKSSELFQFLQTDAINALEQLSGKLERELQEFYCDGLDEAEQEQLKKAEAEKQESAKKAREQEEAENTFAYVPWGSTGKGFQCDATNTDRNSLKTTRQIVMSADRKAMFWALMADIKNTMHATQQYFEKLVQQLEVGLQDIDVQFAAAQ